MRRLRKQYSLCSTVVRMKLKFISLLAALSVSLQIVSTENILFLQTLASKSHHIWNKQIFDRLYDNGHNLTILSFEEETSVPGKTFLVVEHFMERVMAEYKDGWDNVDLRNPFKNIMMMYEYYGISSRILEKDDAVQQLLAYPKTFKFDLIIHDLTMGQFLLGFVEYFGNPPLVSVTAFNIPPHVTTMADTPLRTTYMPHYASCFDSKMSFLERVKNTLYWTVDIFMRNRVYMANENRRIKRLFGKEATSATIIERQSDVVLVNADFSMDYYQALPPNVIPVGGLHVSRKENSPPIINQFIARANKGVILLSFGTNIGSEMLGERINQAIFNVFRSMPNYGFIWKHDQPEKLGVPPPNLLVLKWVPQATVLSNKRTKLFISHGGLLSLQEATWHGVPVVALPMFVDQFSNAEKLVRAGVGVALPMLDIDETKLGKAISTILDEPSFTTKMKERSYHFKGQPQHPLDRAIFWIEKVIENEGLSYLHSPAHDMSVFAVYGLDMVGVVLLVAVGYYLLIRKHFKKRSAPKKEHKSKKE
ncbi:UDP-glycosyltransferase UGT5-like isoform X2 [Wyeomyia smithii]|uniref:UDP-glycosyltransferase UGT5-like isoform X2 n=1 Tax=Wyeomyia smithii TaxID=174621 RepID=UPI0024681625|nr:UDP-glycosyltransferase UGT5-like isoform X2 [Wyeomyia smithii]